MHFGQLCLKVLHHIPSRSVRRFHHRHIHRPLPIYQCIVHRDVCRIRNFCHIAHQNRRCTIAFDGYFLKLIYLFFQRIHRGKVHRTINPQITRRDNHVVFCNGIHHFIGTHVVSTQFVGVHAYHHRAGIATKSRRGRHSRHRSKQWSDAGCSQIEHFGKRFCGTTEYQFTHRKRGGIEPDNRWRQGTRWKKGQYPVRLQRHLPSCFCHICTLVEGQFYHRKPLYILAFNAFYPVHKQVLVLHLGTKKALHLLGTHPPVLLYNIDCG